MSETGENGSDGESDVSLVEDSIVTDPELKEFRKMLEQTYSGKENIFFLTSKTLLKLKKIVSEQMDDEDDLTDFTDFDFFVEWIENKVEADDVILKNVYLFHKNVLPLVYYEKEEGEESTTAFKDNQVKLGDFVDLMFGTSFGRGSAYYEQNFARYSAISTHFVPSHVDYTTKFVLLEAKLKKDVSKFYVSRRFDGFAAVWTGKNLYSRNGKNIFSVIPKEMHSFLTENFANEILIGTMCVASPVTDPVTKKKIPFSWAPIFSENIEASEQIKVCKMLCFFVYDIISLNKRSMSYEDRYEILKDKINNSKQSSVQLVDQIELSLIGIENLKEILYQEFINNRKGLVLTEKDATFVELWNEKKRIKIGVKPKLVANIILNATSEFVSFPKRQGAFEEIDCKAVIDEAWTETSPETNLKKDVFINENFTVRRESRRISDFDISKEVIITPGDFKVKDDEGNDTKYLGVYIDPYFKKEGEPWNNNEKYEQFFMPEFIGTKLKQYETQLNEEGWKFEKKVEAGNEEKTFSKINYLLKKIGYNFDFINFPLVTNQGAEDFGVLVEEKYSFSKSHPSTKQLHMTQRAALIPHASLEKGEMWFSKIYRNSNRAAIDRIADLQNKITELQEDLVGLPQNISRPQAISTPVSSPRPRDESSSSDKRPVDVSSIGFSDVEDGFSEDNDYDPFSNTEFAEEVTDLTREQVRVFKSDFRLASQYSRREISSKEEIDKIVITLEPFVNASTTIIEEESVVTDGTWYTIFVLEGGKIKEILNFEEDIFKIKKSQMEFFQLNTNISADNLQEARKQIVSDFNFFLDFQNKQIVTRRSALARNKKISELEKKYTIFIENFGKNNIGRSTSYSSFVDFFFGDEVDFDDDDTSITRENYLNTLFKVDPGDQKIEGITYLYFNFILSFFILYQGEKFHAFFKNLGKNKNFPFKGDRKGNLKIPVLS